MPPHPKTIGLGAFLLLVLMAAAAPAHAQGLVAAYAFDEGTGSTVTDTSGNGNNGTLQNAAWTAGGKFGGALVFNGTNARVSVPDSSSLDLTAAMTIEAWVYPSVVPSGWKTVVHKETDRYYLAAGSSQNAPAGGGTFAGGNVNAYGASALPANSWTHLAVTYDGAIVRLFVNGIQISTQAASGQITVSSGGLSIGGNTPYGEYLNGRIDDVRVYNRALSNTEIQTDMATPVGGAAPGDPKLVVTAPSEGGLIQGGSVAVAYTTTGSLTGVNSAQFQVDSDPMSEDPSFDGAHQVAGVHIGSHTLTGWLVRADHSKIAFSDATPVHFSNVVSPSDPSPPTVSITAPSPGANVTGLTEVTANASDNVGIHGVLFKLDGANLGAEDLASPFTTSWDTSTAINGAHALTAIARDAAGNETTSSSVTVNVSNVGPNDPSVIGQWSTVQNWPIVAVHAHLLPTGDVLAWTDYTANAGAQLWHPATNTFTPKTFAAVSLFCSGHAYLADGRLLIGGGIVGLSDDLGPHESTLFDPATGSWSAGGLMALGRYYPTVTTLGDGRVLVSGGTTTCNTCIADLPEIYDPVTNVWTPMASSARKAFKYYPHIFLLPDGRVLAAAQNDKAVLTQALDLNTQSWTTIDSRIIDGHSSVMYEPGKIMKAGKATADNPGLPAVATTYVLDMTRPSPAWQATASMAFPRSYLNLTVLPDGQVLATGGGSTTDLANYATAVYAAELWSPTTKTWTTMGQAQNPRLYHSTALLLPDATVLVAGGGRQNGRSQPDPKDQPNAEVFSPPYLFKGPRPTISSAPAVLQYGAPFSVATPDAARVASVALVALGSVTHAFNENQRFVQLTFEQGAGALSVQAPVDGNTAPPGPYMLFLVDTLGVPSVASFVRFPAPWEDAVAPTAPSNLAASPSSGKVTLTWSVATDNTGVTLYNVHRGTAPNVTPSPANRVGQSATTGFVDTGFASGTYYYVVTAQDGGGNVGPKSNEASAAATADATPPTVALTAPAPNAGLSGIVSVTASAGDDVGVAGVQFLLDGASLGAEDPTAPYAFDWNTALAPNGPHTVSARARDARGNTTTATNVAVTVTNDAAAGLAAAYAFDEGAGTLALDSSGAGNRGTVTNAAWAAPGHFGSALSFDGAGDYVRVPNSPSVNVSGPGLTIEMWANITVGSSTDYVLIGKPWTNGSTASPVYQYAIEYDANGGHTLDFFLTDTTGTRRGPVRMTPVLGTFTHVAYTFDGSTVKGYLDGVLTISSPIAANIQARPTDLLIGVDGALGQGFKGRLDDVRLYNRALTQLEVQTDMVRPAAPAVPPVPDGSFGTSMQATRATVDGSTIGLTWDVGSCVGKGYHTVYGPLANLATYQVGGGVCGMGVNGAFSWTGAPADDLWFVVVADDLNGTEGSWGNRSAGTPMNGTVSSSVCGMSGRVNLATCP